MKIKVIADINNIRLKRIEEYIAEGNKYGYMVVRVVDCKLWYYGIYEKPEKAAAVAKEIGNGIVLEV